MSSNIDTSSVVTSSKQMGRVKWFNNKDGYGFITCTNDTTSDIFAHHSAIKIDNQYKYLVQGEYVEFELVSTQNNSSHKFQASNICGINSGKLMCETRNDFKNAKSNYKGSSTTIERQQSDSRPRHQQSSPRQQSDRQQSSPRQQSQRQQSDSTTRGGGPKWTLQKNSNNERTSSAAI